MQDAFAGLDLQIEFGDPDQRAVIAERGGRPSNQVRAYGFAGSATHPVTEAFVVEGR